MSAPVETVASPALEPARPPPTADAGPGRVVAALALGLLSGALASLAFPPFRLWPLIWVAFVPMVVAQHRVAPPRWSGAVVGAAIGAYAAGQLSPGLADGTVAIVFQLLPLYVALLVTALAWRSRAFHERTGYRWLAVSMPVAWVAFDALRAAGDATFGGTWANPAYALYAHPAFLQPVSVFGIWGLELLILVVNFSVAAVVIAALDRRVAHRPPLGWRLARVDLVGALVALVAWGALSGALLDSPAADAATVRVAAVQTGVAVTGDDPTTPAARERYRRYVEQTREAVARGARLVVWNELGLRFDPRTQRTRALRRLAARTGAHLVIGYGAYTDDAGHKINETVVLTPEGRFLGPYGKDHPGTFAGDYSDTGGTYPVFRTALGPIATIICYDLDFTDTARHMTRNGARLVAAPSSDVSSIADTHFTHLVFRAIENRVPMVKSDTRFDSAIIDPWGRVLAHTANPGGRTRATLVADVPLGSGSSLFVSLGDWVGWACVAAAIGFALLGLRTRRYANDRSPRTRRSAAG